MYVCVYIYIYIYYYTQMSCNNFNRYFYNSLVYIMILVQAF